MVFATQNSVKCCVYATFLAHCATLCLNHSLFQHAKDIVHRDIKAENVFLTDAAIKLGDFGFSTQSHASNRLSTFCGSMPYAAPELFTKDSYLGQPADMWAAGVTLYFALSGNLPFVGDSLAQLKANIIRGEFPGLVRGGSLACKNFLRALLCADVDARLTISDVLGSSWLLGLQGSVQCAEAGVEVRISCSTEDDWCIARGREAINPELLLRLQSLGLPLQGADYLEEPRNPTLGTYRILLHQKHLQAHRNWLAKANDDDDGKTSSVAPFLDNSCVHQFASRQESRARRKSVKTLLSVDRSKLQPSSRFCALF